MDFNSNPKKLLTATEVALILAVSTPFVYAMIRAKKIAAIHMGTSVRIQPDALRRFIESNRTDAVQ
jgi:excisionase family DNA binding protein